MTILNATDAQMLRNNISTNSIAEIFTFLEETLNPVISFKLRGTVGKNIYTLRFIETRLAFAIATGKVAPVIENLLAWSFLHFAIGNLAKANALLNSGKEKEASETLSRVTKRIHGGKGTWADSQLDSVLFAFGRDKVKQFTQRFNSSTVTLSAKQQEKAENILEQIQNSVSDYKIITELNGELDEVAFAEEMLYAEISLLACVSRVFAHPKQVGIFQNLWKELLTAKHKKHTNSV